MEARDTAASVTDEIERTYALQHVIFAQIGIDPQEAHNSLKLFPDLPNNSSYLDSLGFHYAKAGNVIGAEEIQAELAKRAESDKTKRISTANALGHVALAHANAGKLNETLQRLAELKETYKGEQFAIFIDATARIAESLAMHGDLARAIDLATSVAGDNPYPLMNIIGGRVRAHDLQEALQIISGLMIGYSHMRNGGLSAPRESRVN